jgi:hypothetical protein
LRFVNEVGTAGFGGNPDEETIGEFVLGATIVRDAVAARRLLTDEPDGDVPGEERRAASADYLNNVIASGLSSITPVLSLTSGSEEGDAVLELNLHAPCCLELFNHVAPPTTFRAVRTSRAHVCSSATSRPAGEGCATAPGPARALRPSGSSGGARPPRSKRTL